MNGKIVGGSIIAAAALAGAGLYYMQVYHFYDEVEADIALTGVVSQQPEPIPHSALEAIDGRSSPIRFRACFETQLSLPMLSETFAIYDDAVPLNAPNWFSCFNSAEIAAELQSGSAIAFLGVKDISYGVDRVVAISETGQGFAWHQLNPCGEAYFDGDRVPADCPTPPKID
ncbi:MAG: DUF6446 family protein [Mangrovicoccus sp.]